MEDSKKNMDAGTDDVHADQEVPGTGLDFVLDLPEIKENEEKYNAKKRNTIPFWAFLLNKRINKIENRLSKIETNLYSSANNLLKSGGFKKAAFIWGHKTYDPADFQILLDHIDVALNCGFLVQVYASSDIYDKLEEHQYGFTYAGDCTYNILKMGCFDYSWDAFLAGYADCIWIMIDDHSWDNTGIRTFDFSGNGNTDYNVPMSEIKTWLDTYTTYPSGKCCIEVRGNKSGLAIAPFQKSDRCVMSSMGTGETIPAGSYDKFNIAPYYCALGCKGAFNAEIQRLIQIGWRLNPQIYCPPANTGC